MKIIYLTQYNILRPTTNRIFDMRLCDGFVSNGWSALKVAPFMRLKENIRRDEIRASYGLKNYFPVRIFWTPLHEDQHGLVNVLVLVSFYFFVSIGLILSNIGKLKKIFFVSRDPKILIPLVALRMIFTKKILPYKLVHVMPEVKKGKISHWVYRHMDGFLASNSVIRDECNRRFGIPSKKFELLIAPVPEFKDDISKEQARRNIGYDSSKPLIVYTGKLGVGLAEIEYYLQAAAALPEYQFLIGGGRKAAVDAFKAECNKRNIDNILFPGFHNDSTFVRNYQLAADVLLSYYTSKDHNVGNSFPQKLTEYMTTGNPVVTPDYPATQDLITSENAFFVQPENTASLIAGIREAVENKALSSTRAGNAKEAVKTLTFENRCKLFIELMKKI
jgi:glycosyltransferase involved in cell wall biosynthesis